MEKNLLSKLQTTLSGIYGNSAFLYDEDGVRHEDLYECSICKFKVKEDEWSPEHKICIHCYHDLLQDQKFKWGEK